ncbi:MAG: hypothetical protein Ct9H300mP1_24830 [Planctomycetaceae bacterium]|nr:MAG: hypothetical protein Ct9H300mP1_24830 [Planctomycetaceae bacterium]
MEPLLRPHGDSRFAARPKRLAPRAAHGLSEMAVSPAPMANWPRPSAAPLCRPAELRSVAATLRFPGGPQAEVPPAVRDVAERRRCPTLATGSQPGTTVAGVPATSMVTFTAVLSAPFGSWYAGPSFYPAIAGPPTGAPGCLGPGGIVVFRSVTPARSFAAGNLPAVPPLGVVALPRLGQSSDRRERNLGRRAQSRH